MIRVKRNSFIDVLNNDPVVRLVTRLLASAIVAREVGRPFSYLAYLERGYKAYGGEIFIYMIAFYLTFKAIGVLYAWSDAAEEDEEE